MNCQRWVKNMAYKIVENAKNVWIRDNADTMDLSPVTDASSVYLTNGRSVEQELGEGSMVSNIVTMNKPIDKVVEGTHNGAFESCVLKGRTLVNLCLNSYTLGNIVDDGKDYIEKTFPIGSSYPQHSHGYNTVALKPNTTYLAIPKYYTDVPDTRSLVRDQTNNINLTSADINDRGIVKFTTRDLPCSRIAYYNMIPTKWGASVSTQEWTSKLSKRIMIIEYVEGMENWDIPYFEGVCDVKSPVLHTTGKNLMPVKRARLDNITANSGGHSKNLIAKNIPVKAGSTYTVTGVRTCSDNFRPMYLTRFEHREKTNSNSHQELWNEILHDSPSSTFTIPHGINYISFTFGNGIYDNDGKTAWVEWDNLQLEELSSATLYEAHKSNTVQTPEEIVLREVDGVCDTYNVLTGEYTQRIGEIVLDGSENEWEDWNENSFVLRGSYFSNAIEHSSPTAPRLKCNNMVAGLGETPRTVRYYKSPTVLWAMVGKNDGETLDQFKQWLSQNPTTIQYILAEPVVTIIEPNTMPFAYENGHIILSSGHEGQSLLPVLEYSTVIGRRGQIQSIAKMTRRHEEKLNMLEQMLVQSILSMDYENTLLALNLEMDEVM